MSIFDVPIAELHEPNELAHFGVKGMKWGRRKARKRSGNGAAERVAKQGRARILLTRDKKSWKQKHEDDTGMGTLRARGLAKRLIKSKGARRKALGRAIVIQRARSRRTMANRPWVRAIDGKSGTYRERNTNAKKAWKKDAQDYRYAYWRGGVLGEDSRQRKRQKRR